MMANITSPHAARLMDGDASPSISSTITLGLLRRDSISPPPFLYFEEDETASSPPYSAADTTFYCLSAAQPVVSP